MKAPSGTHQLAHRVGRSSRLIKVNIKILTEYRYKCIDESIES